MGGVGAAAVVVEPKRLVEGADVEGAPNAGAGAVLAPKPKAVAGAAGAVDEPNKPVEGAGAVLAPKPKAGAGAVGAVDEPNKPVVGAGGLVAPKPNAGLGAEVFPNKPGAGCPKAGAAWGTGTFIT